MIQNEQHTKTIRIAMIMAAGYGTRMGELTRQLPKPLLPLNDWRIIDVVLKKLECQGFKRAVINLHYLPELVRTHINGKQWEMEICFSEEAELLGTGGGIAKAEPFFDGETILAVNADVLCDIDLQEFINYHNRFNPLATMAVLPSGNNRDYSLVVFDGENNLRGFLARNEKIPAALHSGIFIGYHILTPEARTHLSPKPQSIITEFYSRALQEGKPLKIYPFSGKWIDVGTEAFYLSLRKKIQDGEINLATFL